MSWFTRMLGSFLPAKSDDSTVLDYHNFAEQKSKAVNKAEKLRKHQEINENAIATLQNKLLDAKDPNAIEAYDSLLRTARNTQEKLVHKIKTLENGE